MTEPEAPTSTETTEYSSGGDMARGSASAHVETAEEIAADPIDEATDTVVPAPAVESYQTQHAKVLRFEISVGKDDDETDIEAFELWVRQALNDQRDDDSHPFTYHNLTVQGGYYIIDGKVCLPADYDHATKNRKPGTYPPVWAGGPKPSEVQDYLRESTPVSSSTPSKPAAPREEVNTSDTPEEAVAKLAGNMTNEVKASS